MTLKTENDFKDAARALDKGMLRRAFEFSDDAHTPSPVPGVTLAQYKAYMATADHNQLSDSILGDIAPGNKERILRYKEKEDTRRAYEKILKNQIDESNNAIDRQIADLTKIARYHREQQNDAALRRDKELDDLHRFTKIKEDLDEAYLNSKEKVDREKAEKALKAVGIEMPKDATDEQIRLLLLKASGEYGIKITDAGNAYKQADESYQFHAAEAEKYEHLAKKILDDRQKLIESGLKGDDLNAALKKLHDGNKDIIVTAQAKMDQENKVLQELKGFSKDVKDINDSLENKERPVTAVAQPAGPVVL